MDQNFNWQRLIVGILAIILLTIGGSTYLMDPASATGSTGIMIRIGMILGVVWLAMPQLTSMKTKISTALFLVVLLLLIVAASRPNLFRVAAGIIAIGLTLNWALKWISKFTRK